MHVVYRYKGLFFDHACLAAKNMLNFNYVPDKVEGYYGTS